MIDLDLPFDLPEKAPDLAFDDIPVDPLIYRDRRGKHTPADLVERWKQGYPLEEEERKTLTKILSLKHPS